MKPILIARSPRLMISVAVTILVFACSTDEAIAQSNLRTELAAVSKTVKKVLDGRNEDAIAIGQFSGPSHLPTSAGPAISQILSEELKKTGLSIKTRANLTIEGRYRDVVDSDSKLLAAHLKVRVLDRQDNVVIEINRGIFGDATLPTLFGLTTELPTTGNAKQRSEAIAKAIDQPQASITQSQVAPSSQSPFAMEVLVRKSGSNDEPTSRRAENRDGLAFVPITRGEVYQVKLINNADFEAAVNLTVDGLSIFSFSELRNPMNGQPRLSAVLIPPKSFVIIKGWHRNNDHSEEFLVTEYAKSAAAELKSTANIGTITACFSAAWLETAQPPADEPNNAGEYARSGDATGRGARIGVKYQEVQRKLGVVRSTVSIRYTK